MKQVSHALFLLVLLGACLCGKAEAEEGGNPNLYQVTDVAVDVNADNAMHARDKAVLQAQRDAFSQLIARLGGETKQAEQQNDDTIASFVQAFEVQQEKASATRYLGTITVQFKPAAVRAFLSKRGVSYSESKGKPVVLVPLVNINGQILGGDEAAKWRAALEEAARGAVSVPLVVPSVESEAALFPATPEALSTKGDVLSGLAKKFQASSVALAVLTGDVDKPDATKPLEATVSLFDFAGRSGDVVRVPQQMAIDRASAQKYLTEASRQIRNAVEKASALKAKAPAAHVAATAPIETLVLWNELKRKLDTVTFVSKVSVVSFTRAAAKVDLEFRGETSDLKEALSAEGVSLVQTDNGWILQTAKPVF